MIGSVITSLSGPRESDATDVDETEVEGEIVEVGAVAEVTLATDAAADVEVGLDVATILLEGLGRVMGGQALIGGGGRVLDPGIGGYLEDKEGGAGSDLDVVAVSAGLIDPVLAGELAFVVEPVPTELLMAFELNEVDPDVPLLPPAEVAFPVTALPVTALPVTAVSVTALPVTALPVTALSVTALSVTALGDVLGVTLSPARFASVPNEFVTAAELVAAPAPSAGFASPFVTDSPAAPAWLSVRAKVTRELSPSSLDGNDDPALFVPPSPYPVRASAAPVLLPIDLSDPTVGVASAPSTDVNAAVGSSSALLATALALAGSDGSGEAFSPATICAAANDVDSLFCPGIPANTRATAPPETASAPAIAPQNQRR